MSSPSERYAAARRRRGRPELTVFRGEYAFDLDPFQIEGCEALEDGYSVLVCAPTGAVGEEVISHLPASVRLVSLSATVSNAEEFGEWLVSVRGETQVIVHEERPVPLWQHILVGHRMFDLFSGDGVTLDAALLRHVADRTRYVDPRPERRGH